MSQTHIGVLMALGAVIAWSANVVFSRMLAGVVPPFTLTVLRLTVALLVFAPFAGKTFLRDWPLIRARFWFYAFLSLTGLGLFNAIIYMAGKTTTALNMGLINTTSPIFTILLSRVVLGEPLTYGRLVGSSIAFCGVALLTTKGDLAVLRSLSFQPGDLLILTAAFIFSFYTVGMRKKPVELANNSLILTSFIVSVAFLLPFSIWELASGQTVQFTSAAITGILYLGIAASIFGYICWTGAIVRIGSGNTSLIYYTMPLFVAVQAIAFLGEQLHWFHFAAGACIIAGVLIATRR